jgi:hypothetical protein
MTDRLEQYPLEVLSPEEIEESVAFMTHQLDENDLEEFIELAEKVLNRRPNFISYDHDRGLFFLGVTNDIF